MGKLIVIFLWSAIIWFVPADKYYITFVRGNVIHDKTKATLKVGDVVKPSDKLIFPNKTAKISCISPEKGFFVISGQTLTAGSKGELIALLLTSLVTVAGNYAVKPTSTMLNGCDPSTYFTSAETEGRILLIQNEPIAMKQAYKLDEKNFFFVQYNSKGRIVIQKISQDERGLIFSDKIFITASGTIAEKVNLYYQSNVNGSSRSTQIASFTPVFASKSEIQEQINLISKHLDNSATKKLKSVITQHLYMNYGKIGDDELTKLFGL